MDPIVRRPKAVKQRFKAEDRPLPSLTSPSFMTPSTPRPIQLDEVIARIQDNIQSIPEPEEAQVPKAQPPQTSASPAGSQSGNTTLSRFAAILFRLGSHSNEEPSKPDLAEQSKSEKGEEVIEPYELLMTSILNHDSESLKRLIDASSDGCNILAIDRRLGKILNNMITESDRWLKADYVNEEPGSDMCNQLMEEKESLSAKVGELEQMEVSAVEAENWDQAEELHSRVEELRREMWEATFDDKEFKCVQIREMLESLPQRQASLNEQREQLFEDLLFLYTMIQEISGSPEAESATISSSSVDQLVANLDQIENDIFEKQARVDTSCAAKYDSLIGAEECRVDKLSAELENLNVEIKELEKLLQTKRGEAESMRQKIAAGTSVVEKLKIEREVELKTEDHLKQRLISDIEELQEKKLQLQDSIKLAKLDPKELSDHLKSLVEKIASISQKKNTFQGAEFESRAELLDVADTYCIELAKCLGDYENIDDLTSTVILPLEAQVYDKYKQLESFKPAFSEISTSAIASAIVRSARSAIVAQKRLRLIIENEPTFSACAAKKVELEAIKTEMATLDDDKTEAIRLRNYKLAKTKGEEQKELCDEEQRIKSSLSELEKMSIRAHETLNSYKLIVELTFAEDCIDAAFRIIQQHKNRVYENWKKQYEEIADWLISSAKEEAPLESLNVIISYLKTNSD